MKIYVAGHQGLVGSAIVRKLEAQSTKGFEVVTRTRGQLDLEDQRSVRVFFENERPDVVILAAAKVGGILANQTYPAEFIYENLMIESNVIHEAWTAGVQRLVNVSSTCIYPKNADQPIREEALLTGTLEPTNEPYAIAKIAAIKLCESYNRQYGVDYRTVVPSNLYGPGDNFHLNNAHVLPALLRRFHEARERGEAKVVVWGSGRAVRDFLHVDDMAEGVCFVMNLPEAQYRAKTSSMLSHVNLSTGNEVSIVELAETIAKVTGFIGRIEFDKSKPDGAVRRVSDAALINSLGWRSHISLLQGIGSTYEWFLENKNNIRG